MLIELLSPLLITSASAVLIEFLAPLPHHLFGRGGTYTDAARYNAPHCLHRCPAASIPEERSRAHKRVSTPEGGSVANDHTQSSKALRARTTTSSLREWRVH